MSDVVFVDPNASSLYPQLLLNDNNIYIIQGDTKTLNYQVQLGGTSVDITGFQGIRMTAKWQYEDPDTSAVFVKTVGTGITVTGTSTGLFNVVISPSDTRTFAGQSIPSSNSDIELVYDIQLTDSNANIYTGRYGKLIVRPDVSISSP